MNPNPHTPNPPVRPPHLPAALPGIITEELQNRVVHLYQQAASGARHPSLQSIAKTLEASGIPGITPLKIRRILITAGVYESRTAARISELRAEGRSVSEIMSIMNLSRASVHAYLPYPKERYQLNQPHAEGKNEEPADGTDGTRSSKAGQEQPFWEDPDKAYERLQQEKNQEYLWEALKRFAGQPFTTAKGLEFSYTIRGGELFVDRKEKSITRATVDMAFQRAVELGAAATGPKKLGVFGASYLYPIFIKLGVITLP